MQNVVDKTEPADAAPAEGPAPRDYLLYDGECPVCSRYVLWTGMRSHHPGIGLLDARAHPDLVAELRADGVEINDTMVLQVDGERFVGAAAMARIAGYLPDDRWRARVLRRLTGSRQVLQPLYPLLVRGRKLLLALLGRQQIR